MGASQTSYILEKIPDAASIKTVPSDEVAEVILSDVEKASFVIADWDLDKRVGFKCCGGAKKKKFTNFTIMDAQIEGMLQSLFNEKATSIGCCAERRLQNLFKTHQSPDCSCGCSNCKLCGCELDVHWCRLCFCGLVGCFLCGPFACLCAPLMACCCGAGCQGAPTKVSKLERVKALISAAKAMENEISLTPDPYGCLCCGGTLQVNKFFMKMAAKFALYAEAEQILKESIELQPIATELGSVSSLNRFYKDAVLKPRNAYDRLSQYFLVNTIGSEDFTYFSKESIITPFDSECTLSHLFTADDIGLLDSKFVWKKDKDGVKVYDLPSDFESLPEFAPLCERINMAVLANYEGLGVDSKVLPGLTQEVARILTSKMNVETYSCRLKEARSIAATHSSGKVFDMFGVRFYVSTDSVFQTFCTCFVNARIILDLPSVHSIAVSHKLRSKGFFDFKLVVRFRAPQDVQVMPIVEFQVVPVSNFITDIVTGGAFSYKDFGEDGKSGPNGTSYINDNLGEQELPVAQKLHSYTGEVFNIIGEKMER